MHDSKSVKKSLKIPDLDPAYCLVAFTVFELTKERMETSEQLPVTPLCFPKKLHVKLRLGELGNRLVKFEMDSEATCNIISQKTLEDCPDNIALTNVNRILSMFSQTVLTPIGHCTTDQRQEWKKISGTFHVSRR